MSDKNDELQADLVDNWDTLVSWNSDIDKIENTAVFKSSVSRDKAEQIENFIVNKDNGSMIVSGQKGSGKTTTLICNLKKLVNKCDKYLGNENNLKMIPIYINSVYFNSYDINIFDKEFISQSDKNTKSFNEISSQQKIVLTEFLKILITNFIDKLHSSYPNYYSTDLEDLKNCINAVNYTEKINQKNSLNSGLALNVPSQLLLKPELSTNNQYLTEKNIEFNHLTLDNLVKKFEKVLKEIEQNFKDIEETYISNLSIVGLISLILDFISNSIGAILHPLKSLINLYKICVELKKNSVKDNFSILLSKIKKIFHNILSLTKRKKTKIIFIIDELDSINCDIDPLLEFIKKFKNFFNNSSLHFIFVVDPLLYQKVIEAKGDNKNKTLFSEKVYFNKPIYKEMSKFLDEIIIFDANKEDYKLFKYFAVYKASSNYYELIQLLKTRIEIKENRYKLNIFLDIEQKNIAKLFCISNYVYESSYFEPNIEKKYLDEVYDRFNEIINYLTINGSISLENIFFNDDNQVINKKLQVFSIILKNFSETKDINIENTQIIKNIFKLKITDIEIRMKNQPVLNIELNILTIVKDIIQNLYFLNNDEYLYSGVYKDLINDFFNLENYLSKLNMFETMMKHLNDTFAKNLFIKIKHSLLSQFSLSVENKNIELLRQIESEIENFFKIYIFNYSNLVIFKLKGDIGIIGDKEKNLVFNAPVDYENFLSINSACRLKIHKNYEKNLKINFEVYFDNISSLKILFLEKTNYNLSFDELGYSKFYYFNLESITNDPFSNTELNLSIFSELKGQKVISKESDLNLHTWHTMCFIHNKKETKLLINNVVIFSKKLDINIEAIDFANSKGTLQIRNLTIE